MSDKKIRFDPATGVLYVCDPRVKGFVMCDPAPEQESAPEQEPAQIPAQCAECKYNDFQRLIIKAQSGDEEAEKELSEQIRARVENEDACDYVDGDDQNLANRHEYDEDSEIWVEEVNGRTSGCASNVESAWNEAVEMIVEELVGETIGNAENGCLLESAIDVWNCFCDNLCIEIKLVDEVRDALEVLDSYRGGIIPPYGE